MNRDVTQQKLIELFISNNQAFLDKLKKTIIYKFSLVSNRDLRKLAIEQKCTDGIWNTANQLNKSLNLIQSTILYKIYIWTKAAIQDIIVCFHQIGDRASIDKRKQIEVDYLSIACIVKNEALDIAEWILFHKRMGVDRIYIYDNESDDDLVEILEPYLVSGYVVYKKWVGKKVQAAAYRHAIRKTKKTTKWLAFIDADEFLFSPHGTIPQVLHDYEDYAGVCVNWVIFGPSGNVTRPSNGVVNSYLETPSNHDNEYNCRVKSIVRPDLVLTINSPHFAFYKKDLFAVDEDRDPVDNFAAYKEGLGRAFTATNHRRIIRINHYVTKSIEDLERKCNRGYPDGHKNAVIEEQLAIFDCELEKDLTIIDALETEDV